MTEAERDSIKLAVGILFKIGDETIDVVKFIMERVKTVDTLDKDEAFCAELLPMLRNAQNEFASASADLAGALAAIPATRKDLN